MIQLLRPLGPEAFQEAIFYRINSTSSEVKITWSIVYCLSAFSNISSKTTGLISIRFRVQPLGEKKEILNI